MLSLPLASWCCCYRMVYDGTFSCINRFNLAIEGSYKMAYSDWIPRKRQQISRKDSTAHAKCFSFPHPSPLTRTQTQISSIGEELIDKTYVYINFVRSRQRGNVLHPVSGSIFLSATKCGQCLIIYSKLLVSNR
jgi:hypothetical protein